jgi:DNA polymerase-2
VTSLWKARDEAKRNKSQAFNTALKLVMNSFAAGVLGASECRFFNPQADFCHHCVGTPTGESWLWRKPSLM